MPRNRFLLDNMYSLRWSTNSSAHHWTLQCTGPNSQSTKALRRSLIESVDIFHLSKPRSPKSSAEQVLMIIFCIYLSSPKWLTCASFFVLLFFWTTLICYGYEVVSHKASHTTATIFWFVVLPIWVLTTTDSSTRVLCSGCSRDN
jgi:hypothetical protein